MSPLPVENAIKVLLIEDDEEDFILIHHLLTGIKSSRYETTWAQEYEEALDELMHGCYDVCLLDYRLGPRNGLDVLHRVQDCYYERPPIIVLTGQGDYEVDLEAMKSGAADFLVKDRITDTMLERSIRYAIDRKKSEDALRESEKQLDYLSAQLLVVQENERRKVAAELHDNLGQVLTAIKYNIEGVMNRVPPGASFAGDLEAVIPLMQGAVDSVRRIYTQLRPSVLDDLGIKAAISWYSREFESANEQIVVAKELDLNEEQVPDSLKLVIFRIVQEAMDNISAHSCASRADVSLSVDDGGLRLRIADDGTGFDVTAKMSQTSSSSGLGLRSIKRRAELSGGAIRIVSKPGSGTDIIVNWPLGLGNATAPKNQGGTP